MKRFWPSIVWFCAGATLGQFAESVLFPLWAKLGLLMPIARWVASFGHDSLDWWWLIVHIWLVSWLVVALVSVIGGRYIKRHLLLDMLLFGVGAAFVPLALHAYLYSSVPSFADYVQHAFIVGVAVVCGLLSHSFRLKHANKTSNFSVERMAAGDTCLQIRTLGVRRHRSPSR
jgi:hypothetical protein